MFVWQSQGPHGVQGLVRLPAQPALPPTHQNVDAAMDYQSRIEVVLDTGSGSMRGQRNDLVEAEIYKDAVVGAYNAANNPIAAAPAWAQNLGQDIQRMTAQIGQLANNVNQTNTRLDQTNNRLDQLSNEMNNRLDQTNNRLDQTNNRLDQLSNEMNNRLNQTNNRLDQLSNDMNNRLDQTNNEFGARFDQLRGQFDGFDSRLRNIQYQNSVLLVQRENRLKGDGTEVPFGILGFEDGTTPGDHNLPLLTDMNAINDIEPPYLTQYIHLYQIPDNRVRTIFQRRYLLAVHIGCKGVPAQ